MKLRTRLGDLPLAVYVPPSEKDQAANAFLDTKSIIEFYQQEIGVPFNWDKYSQVYCHDFLAGGMENASCTFPGCRIALQQVLRAIPQSLQLLWMPMKQRTSGSAIS